MGRTFSHLLGTPGEWAMASYSPRYRWCLTSSSRRTSLMSLHPHVIEPVPDETARVAHAAFPKGHPYLTFRDVLGTVFQDEDFSALFPAWGQPGLPPWRLALVTIMPFRENLADRQAAEAVRARIDWKYLLSLELTDPGFDFSVLSEFRDRLLAGSAAELLLDKLLARCRALGLLTARGQQRTAATPRRRSAPYRASRPCARRGNATTSGQRRRRRPRRCRPCVMYDSKRTASCRPRPPASNPRTMSRRATARSGTRRGPGTWSTSVRRVSPRPRTSSRTSTRRRPRCMKRSVRSRFSRRSSRRRCRHASTSSMPRISARNSSSAAATSRTLSCAVPLARARAGKPRSRARTAQSSLWWTGTSSRYAVPKGTCRRPGGSTAGARAVARSLSNLPRRRVRRARSAPRAPVPNAAAAGWGSRRAPRRRPWPTRGSGMPVRKAKRSMHNARASKGPSPRECVRLGCAGHGIGGWRKPTCSTSRLPLRSILTAWSRGSTSAHRP